MSRPAKIFLLSAVAIVVVGFFSAHALEVEETAKSAFGAFLNGHYDEAVSGYKYLDTLGSGGVAPTVSMALLARDQGNPQEALPLWVKASLLAPQNAFIWNQRGWSYLSMGRRHDALDSFHKALEASSAPADTAEAQFAIGMTEMLESNLKSSLASYQEAYVKSPYLLAVTAAELGRMAVRFKRWTPAELYFKQSLDQDPSQPDVARELGRVYEKMSLPKSAWLAYKLSLDIDPSNAEALHELEKNARYFREKPETLIAVRRMAQPLLRKPVAPPESPLVRVGLFSNTAGDPAHATHVYFMSEAEFRIVDVKLGEVNQGKPYEQWEITFQPSTNVIEIRDVHHQLQYTTKQAFRIEPKTRGASVLLKSVELADVKGVDIGDKEVRGVVEAIPTPYGFHLINELTTDEYLFSIVGSVMPQGTPVEAMKADAVVQRSKLEYMRRLPSRDPFKIDICDSAHCQAYQGLSGERMDATQAVLDTVGAMLYQGGAVADVHQQINCAGMTEEGIQDRAAPGPGVRSVWDLEMLTHEYPAQENYCEVSPLALASWSRWMHVLDAKVLRSNLGDKNVGRIHEVRVTRRSSTGRVLAMEVEGPGGKLTLEGRPAIDGFLYPGGLRSNLFTIQPVYRGHILEYLIVWGAGTGDGHGMCVAGSLGQAHGGRDAWTILHSYFPNLEIRGIAPPAVPSTRSGRSRGAYSTRTKALTPSKLRLQKAQELRERMRRKAQQRQAPAVKASTVPAADEGSDSQPEDDSTDSGN